MNEYRQFHTISDKNPNVNSLVLVKIGPEICFVLKTKKPYSVGRNSLVVQRYGGAKFSKNRKKKRKKGFAPLIISQKLSNIPSKPGYRWKGNRWSYKICSVTHPLRPHFRPQKWVQSMKYARWPKHADSGTITLCVKR